MAKVQITPADIGGIKKAVALLHEEADLGGQYSPLETEAFRQSAGVLEDAVETFERDQRIAKKTRVSPGTLILLLVPSSLLLLVGAVQLSATVLS